MNPKLEMIEKVFVSVSSHLEAHDFTCGNLSIDCVISKVKSEYDLNPDLVKYLIRYYLQDHEVYGTVRGVNGGIYSKNLKTSKQLKKEKLDSIKQSILDKFS